MTLLWNPQVFREIFLKHHFLVYLVDLREMQTWGSLGQKKGIMKMHKQVTVFASEAEPQELQWGEGQCFS